MTHGFSQNEFRKTDRALSIGATAPEPFEDWAGDWAGANKITESEEDDEEEKNYGVGKGMTMFQRWMVEI